MRLKNLALAVFVCIGAVACRASYADTLTLAGTSNQVVDGVYVYPYNLSFDTSAQSIPMMCINYQDEVTQGETWQVTGQAISTSSSTQLKEDLGRDAGALKPASSRNRAFGCKPLSYAPACSPRRAVAGFLAQQQTATTATICAP